MDAPRLQAKLLGGALYPLKEKELLKEILDVVPQFQKDFTEIKERVERLQPYLQEAHRRIWAEEVGTARAACDYIAGMTDRFAESEHERLAD